MAHRDESEQPDMSEIWGKADSCQTPNGLPEHFAREQIPRDPRLLGFSPSRAAGERGVPHGRVGVCLFTGLQMHAR
jgi:hypothetical protein